MDRRAFLGLPLAPLLAAAARELKAQGERKVHRIGWVSAQSAASLASSLEVVRAGLAERGYVEGRNLTLVFRFGDDDIERVPAMAAELDALPVDIMIAQGAAVSVINTLSLKAPIVYVFSGDPLAAGFADTLARPRHNMTGLTLLAAEMNGKRLELLREIVPAARRIAILANPEHPGENLEWDYTANAARGLGYEPRHYQTPTPEALDQAFAAMTTDRPQGIILFSDGFAVAHRERIIDFSMRQRVPVVTGWPIFARSGAICTYGPNIDASYRRLAYYADRILKGARPADLPIERPTKFQLVVNLRTAKALGITVPQAVLVRADDVIA